MNDFLFGQDGQSKMQTSPTKRDLIDGIEVSKAVSKIAKVGTIVRVFRFAWAGIVVIAIVIAIRPTVISFFIRLILLNAGVIVNKLSVLCWIFAWIPFARIHIF